MNEESNQIPKTKTPKEQIIELFTGKTVEEIEENNRVVKALLDEMHNVSVGDIFTDLDGVYRVLEVRDNEELSEGLNELLENIDTAYLSYPDSEDDDGSGPIVTLIK